MKNVRRTVAVALLAAALTVGPAWANPAAEPGGQVFAAIAGVVALGGLVTAGVIYALYKLYWSKNPRFVREDVTITLEAERAGVDGFYRFHNPGDKPRTLRLRYPFARGPQLGEPGNVVVRDEAGAALPFTWEHKQIAFDVTIPPQGDAVVEVSYEQPCRGGNFTYIVTTTRRWRRPIDVAHFVVEAPAALAPIKSSYEFEETAAGEDSVRYEFRRENFYPDVDLHLYWERADPYAGSAAPESGDDPAAEPNIKTAP